MLSSNVINGKFRNLSAPITVHSELTSACNEKCRHCYNFWREDSMKRQSISWDNLRFTINEIKSNNVFHVILTGGEPFLIFDKLIYAVKAYIDAGISVSVNSNLMLATAEKMVALKNAGLEHILTSVNSYDNTTNDYIANTPGALDKIMNGIKITQEAGIRVTPNMIVSNINKDHVYKTGEFLHRQGINKILANRTIPPKNNSLNCRDEFIFNKEIAKVMFDELIKLKEDFGMEVGTCRTVPNCFFSDLDKYSVFVGRGCSAGKKHLLLNVDGDAHACVHEEKKYGNIHEVGLKRVWENMEDWRKLDYIPKKCQDCSLFYLCDGGCRLVAMGHNGSISGVDNLCVGAKNILPYNNGITEEILDKVKTGIFKVVTPLKFRKEEEFYIFRILGAKVAFVDNNLAELFIKYGQSDHSFTLKDIGEEHKIKIANLVKEGLIKCLSSRGN